MATVLYHPNIAGVIHTLQPGEEEKKWTDAGWLKTKPGTASNKGEAKKN